MVMIPSSRLGVAACMCLISLTAIINARPGSPGSSIATDQFDDGLGFMLEDPWPAGAGMPPQFKLRSSWLLRKRECLENGSNYCFGNNEDFCPDCGGCCSEDDVQWCCSDPEASCCPGSNCCEPGTTCCGEGCCTEGQKCTDGKCEVPVVTVTETKTTRTTETNTKVEVVTVEKKVVETSTINSIITTTVTSEQGTHTEITYVTTTVIANAKRAVPTASPVARQAPAAVERPRGLLERAALDLWNSLVYGGEQAPFDATITQISPTEPRHCPATTTPPDALRKRQADATSTKTVFVTTTIVDTTTVNDKRTTTTEVTSVFKTTIFQTSTRVIGATATVSTTSTVTITSRTAETQTITSTSTFIDSPAETGSPGDGSGGDSSGQDGSDGDDGDDGDDDGGGGGLSNSAVIGIGVGAGLVALTLAILAFFFWRRKQKQKNIPQSYDFTYSQAPQMTSPKQPTLPFMAAAPHHGKSYTPTTSDANTGTTPDSFNKTTAGVAAAGAGAGAAAAGGRGHTRNNSSISNTLVNNNSGQATPDAYRDSINSAPHHQSWSGNASEMPAEPRYELGETGGEPQQQPSPPPPQQQQQQQGRPHQFRTGPHPSTSSISRVTRFAELDGAGGGRIT